jgi:hypothetical protein
VSGVLLGLFACQCGAIFAGVLYLRDIRDALTIIARILEARGK